MPVTTFFQSCPICGRELLIPIECLGQQVACKHCCGHFQSRDTSYDSYLRDNQEPTLMDRANTLLMYGMSRQFRNRLEASPFPFVTE